MTTRLAAVAVLGIAVTFLAVVELAVVTAHLFFVGFANISKLLLVATNPELVNNVVKLILVYDRHVVSFRRCWYHSTPL